MAPVLGGHRLSTLSSMLHLGLLTMVTPLLAEPTLSLEADPLAASPIGIVAH